MKAISKSVRAILAKRWYERRDFAGWNSLIANPVDLTLGTTQLPIPANGFLVLKNFPGDVTVKIGEVATPLHTLVFDCTGLPLVQMPWFTRGMVVHIDGDVDTDATVEVLSPIGATHTIARVIA